MPGLGGGRVRGGSGDCGRRQVGHARRDGPAVCGASRVPGPRDHRACLLGAKPLHRTGVGLRQRAGLQDHRDEARPRTVGAGDEGRRDIDRRSRREAPRRILPLAIPAQQGLLHVRRARAQHRARPSARTRGRLPPRGYEVRRLPLSVGPPPGLLRDARLRRLLLRPVERAARQLRRDKRDMARRRERRHRMVRRRERRQGRAPLDPQGLLQARRPAADHAQKAPRRNRLRRQR